MSWPRKFTKTNGIYPSDYAAIKIATTSASGQSEKMASNTRVAVIKNKDLANSVLVAFGDSYSDAENNLNVSGQLIPAGFDANLQNLQNKKYIAWVSVVGSISIFIGYLR